MTNDDMTTGDEALQRTLEKNWTVPPASPWLVEKATARILADRAQLWPWTPRRLAAAFSAAGVLGCVGGLLLPVAAADAADMISLLW